MLTLKVIWFLLNLCVAKSEVDFKTVCKNDYRNLSNDKIDVLKYCSHNICIEKCCDEGEFFSFNGTCVNATLMFQRFPRIASLYKDVDYSKIDLYSWDENKKNFNLKSKKNFIFVRNHRDVNNCTSNHPILNDFAIIEDGSMRMQDTSGSKSWSNLKRLEYCVEFKLTNINKKPQVKLQVREYMQYADPEDKYKKLIYKKVGMLITSFFLLLVLLVYCLLPELQNIIGLILMAYTATILVTFLLKIGSDLSIRSMTSKHCKIISPMIYFGMISIFFWLNIMSFDVWWSLRGHRKRRNINRRGERVKFMWYCLYAWGVPVLITGIVTKLDNIDLSNINIVKPPFDDCFAYDEGVLFYLTIPIGVIIFVNIILFLLTVYNIWMIKRAVQRCEDSRSSKRDTNRFITYIKLFVVMGVSWCLELIPSGAIEDFWLFVLSSISNVLIGVVIFCVFVFNKRILIKLCKRFNIKNDFTRRLEASQSTTSGTTSKTTREK